MRYIILYVYLRFADEEAKSETLAIRFANSDNAKKFKVAFDDAVISVTEYEAERISKAEELTRSPAKTDAKTSSEEASQQLSALSLKDKE